MPWVSQALLDELIAAQQMLRAIAVRRSEGEGPRGTETGVSATPRALRPQRAAEAEPLPPMVRAACEQYAFGDPYERAANTQRAMAMYQAGKSPSDIIAAIKTGAAVPEVFV